MEWEGYTTTVGTINQNCWDKTNSHSHTTTPPMNQATNSHLTIRAGRCDAQWVASVLNQTASNESILHYRAAFQNAIYVCGAETIPATAFCELQCLLFSRVAMTNTSKDVFNSEAAILCKYWRNFASLIRRKQENIHLEGEKLLRVLEHCYPTAEKFCAACSRLDYQNNMLTLKAGKGILEKATASGKCTLNADSLVRQVIHGQTHTLIPMAPLEIREPLRPQFIKLEQYENADMNPGEGLRYVPLDDEYFFQAMIYDDEEDVFMNFYIRSAHIDEDVLYQLLHLYVRINNIEHYRIERITDPEELAGPDWRLYTYPPPVKCFLCKRLPSMDPVWDTALPAGIKPAYKYCEEHPNEIMEMASDTEDEEPSSAQPEPCASWDWNQEATFSCE